jgi:hypothetical protein
MTTGRAYNYAVDRYNAVNVNLTYAVMKCFII